MPRVVLFKNEDGTFHVMVKPSRKSDRRLRQASRVPPEKVTAELTRLIPEVYPEARMDRLL